MSAGAVALAFFDPSRDLQGMLRAGGALLFEHGRAESATQEAELRPANGSWRAVVGQQLELTFSPLSPPLDLGGAEAHLCGVGGRVGEATLDCLGTIIETTVAPSWAELDAVRSISAVWDADTALLAAVRRPRGALGHGEERSTAWLVADGVPVLAEKVRLSTVYDAGARQRSAGLELWLPDEDLPRRVSGRAIAGTSIELEDLVVHAAVFSWTMEGREGQGVYELTVRDAPVAA